MAEAQAPAVVALTMRQGDDESPALTSQRELKRVATESLAAAMQIQKRRLVVSDIQVEDGGSRIEMVAVIMPGVPSAVGSADASPEDLAGQLVCSVKTLGGLRRTNRSPRRLSSKAGAGEVQTASIHRHLVTRNQLHPIEGTEREDISEGKGSRNAKAAWENLAVVQTSRAHNGKEDTEPRKRGSRNVCVCTVLCGT